MQILGLMSLVVVALSCPSAYAAATDSPINKQTASVANGKRTTAKDDVMVLTIPGVPRQEYRLYPYRGTRVSKDCVDGRCMALQRPPHGIKPPDGGEWTGYAGSKFCVFSDGSNLIAEHADHSQDGLCVFGDGSYMLDWDYYYFHVGKNN